METQNSQEDEVHSAQLSYAPQSPLQPQKFTNPQQNTVKGNNGTGSAGKKTMNRVGTTPNQPAGGQGLGYNEIRHNILAPGHGFMGASASTTGQMEGRGLSNFFMKKMGGAPVIQIPGGANQTAGSKKKKKGQKSKNFHPLKSKKTKSSNQQQKLNIEIPEETKQGNTEWGNHPESTSHLLQNNNKVSNVSIQLTRIQKQDIENNQLQPRSQAFNFAIASLEGGGYTSDKSKKENMKHLQANEQPQAHNFHSKHEKDLELPPISKTNRGLVQNYRKQNGPRVEDDIEGIRTTNQRTEAVTQIASLNNSGRGNNIQYDSPRKYQNGEIGDFYSGENLANTKTVGLHQRDRSKDQVPMHLIVPKNNKQQVKQYQLNGSAQTQIFDSREESVQDLHNVQEEEEPNCCEPQFYQAEEEEEYENSRYINALNYHQEFVINYKEDVRMASMYYYKLLLVEYSAMFLGFFGLLICILDQELTLKDGDLTSWRYSLLVYNMLCTIVLMFALYSRYYLQLKLLILNGKAFEFETIKSIGWRNYLFKEYFIVLLAPLPGLNLVTFREYNVDYDIYVKYDVNDILLALMFFRIFLFARWIVFNTDYMRPRSQRVCMMNGCDAGQMYALKALMRENPYLCIVGTIITSIIIYAYQVKIFETPICKDTPHKLDHYHNTLWLIVITITTVGYGDMYPKTHLGRFVAITACFTGFILISLFVVSMTNWLSFSCSEENSFTLLKRLEYREEIRDKAIMALGSAMSSRTTRKREPYNTDKIDEKNQKMKRRLREFSHVVENIRNFVEPDTDSEVQRRLMRSLADQIDFVRSRQDGMDNKIDLILALLTQQPMQNAYVQQEQEPTEGEEQNDNNSLMMLRNNLQHQIQTPNNRSAMQNKANQPPSPQLQVMDLSQQQ